MRKYFYAVLFSLFLESKHNDMSAISECLEKYLIC